MSDKDKTWTGTITALNDKDHTVKVEQYLFHKTFVLGDNCVLAIWRASQRRLQRTAARPENPRRL